LRVGSDRSREAAGVCDSRRSVHGAIGHQPETGLQVTTVSSSDYDADENSC